MKADFSIDYAYRWKSLPWKEFEKTLFQLQCKLYRAVYNKDKQSINYFQRLIFTSRAAKFLAVREVTKQIRNKKNVARDHPSNNHYQYKFKLVENVKLFTTNGSRLNQDEYNHILSIINEYLLENIIYYALEPIYEVYYSSGAYGWKVSKNENNAIFDIRETLRFYSKSTDQKVLKVSCNNFLKRINYNFLFSLFTLPKKMQSTLKHILLKKKTSTFFEDSLMNSDKKSDKLGNLILHLLLNGIEDLNNHKDLKAETGQKGFRYNASLIFILDKYQDPNILIDNIKMFLKRRLFNLENITIETIQIRDGFDCFSWSIRANIDKKKIVVSPSTISRKNFKSKIKKIVKDTRFNLEKRLEIVQSNYKLWLHSNQYCCSASLHVFSIKKWLYTYIRNNSTKSRSQSKEILKNIFSV